MSKPAMPEPNDAHEPIPGTKFPTRGPRVDMLSVGLVVLVAGMFAFAYANAQYFVMLCQKVGFLSAESIAVRGSIVETSGGRKIDVYFDAVVNDNLPIAFSVKERFQRTTQGTRAINDYRFVNLSRETIYFRPVHDVSPISAGMPETLVLEKCFCFEEQKIEPRQEYVLPVVYSFTDKLDPTAATISMRYSLFLSTKERWEEAQKNPGIGKLRPGSPAP